MNKLVSIITPCYNSEKFISETIMSVKSQTYVNWEMLITDDGSTDNSISIIKNFIESDDRIKLFSIKNSGPAIARNNSIKRASGKYLAFIDSDDLWDVDFLKISQKKVERSQGFVFSSYRRCDEQTLEKVYRDFIVPKKVKYKDILMTNSISCLTAFIDIEKLGKEYMPEIQYRQDMGLWLKYLKKVDFAVGILQPNATYRIRKNSHSRNKKKLLKPQWYFYRHIEELSIFKSLFLMIVWAINGFKKYR